MEVSLCQIMVSSSHLNSLVTINQVIKGPKAFHGDEVRICLLVFCLAEVRVICFITQLATCYSHSLFEGVTGFCLLVCLAAGGELINYEGGH